MARATLGEPGIASYRIGELAAKLGMTERTIRYYEELGLLDSVKRLDGGTRVYTDDDVRRLKFVRKLKVLGLSLQEMHELEGMYKTERSNRTVLPRLIELLDAHLSTVDGRISELHALREGGRVDDRDGAAADSYEESRPGERGDQAHALPDRRERGVPVAEQLLGHEHGQQGREPRTEDEAHRAVAPFRPLRSSR
jgi:DNA-binding transcriptional MerR regulator